MNGEPIWCQLERREDTVAEAMCFLPDAKTGRAAVGGKFFQHLERSDREPGSGVKDMLIVQHGLPGVDWRLDAERKARNLVRGRHDAGVLVLVPQGLKQFTDTLGVSDEDIGPLRMSAPPSFGRAFTLSHYVKEQFAALQAVRIYLPLDEGCNMHLAGHSYAATGTLYALRRCLQEDVALPSSANFLAPFLKTVIGAKDPGIRMHVINRKERTGKEKGRTSGDHERELSGVLDGCSAYYEGVDGERLLAMHRKFFREALLERIGYFPVEVLEDCEMRAFVGGGDKYIDPDEHVRFLADRLQTTRRLIERVLPEDTHDLESLDFRRLIDR